MPAYWTKWTFQDDFLKSQGYDSSVLKASFVSGTNKGFSSSNRSLPPLWCPCRKRTYPQVQDLLHVPAPRATMSAYSVSLLSRCGMDMSPESPPSMEKLAELGCLSIPCTTDHLPALCSGTIPECWAGGCEWGAHSPGTGPLLGCHCSAAAARSTHLCRA